MTVDFDSLTFETSLYHDDPYTRDHRVYGVRVLPGVFLLELIYRVLRREGIAPESVELRDVLFQEPITTTPDRPYTVGVCVESDGNCASVVVQGRTATDDASDSEGGPQHLTAEIHPTDERKKEEGKLTGWREETELVGNTDLLYDFAQELNIQHGEFMRVQGALHRGAEGLVADASLTELAQSFQDAFLLHPAYLDFATLLPFMVLRRSGHEMWSEPFIPLHIERFRLKNLEDQHCIVQVREADVESVSSEMVQSSFRLYTSSGRIQAIVEGFSAKRIREVDSLDSPTDRRRAMPGEEDEEVRKTTGKSSSGEENTGRKGKEDGQDRTGPERSAQRLLRSMMANRIGEAPDAVSLDGGFYEYGLESEDVLSLVDDLEERLDETLYPTLLFEYTTIRELAEYLGKTYPDAVQAAAGPSDSTAGVSAAASEKKSRSSDSEAEIDGSGDAPLVDTGEGRTSQQQGQQQGTNEPIAVIGMAGRYPEAQTVGEFWENLVEGTDCITQIPQDRWDVDSFYDPEGGSGKTYSRWGGHIDRPDAFDPLVFQISPREAERMSPQERIFLETVWETFEDAGYTSERLRRYAPSDDRGASVGVFSGVMWSDYQLFGWEASLRGADVRANSWFSSVANRPSYVFNLNGPSMPVPTACSSSLYALHLACKSLHREECRMAVAGGVNLSLHPYKYVKLSEKQMLSPDGRCKTFGADADGYVPGEGTGALLLKPLSAAEADGDRIYAVVRGSAVNHNGQTSGFSVPSQTAQASLIREALENAGVDARTIGMIEAHGTGTELGDPIEVEGIRAVLDVENRLPCSLGSVKSNVGHLEAAAGVAGLTKAILCLDQQQFVPSLHASPVNPKIESDLQDSSFSVQQEPERWPQPTIEGEEVPRRAGVSSFGAGGTNVHAVLEEYKSPAPETASSTGPEIVPLSARTPERLEEYARRLRDALGGRDEKRLRDVAFTLQVGRPAMQERLALVGEEIEEIQNALSALIDGQSVSIPFLRGNVLEGEEDGDEPIDLQVLRSHVEAGELETVARRWVEGGKIDWESLFEDRGGHPVSLPTYPFERERYWIDTGNVEVTFESISSSKEDSDGAAQSASQNASHPLLDREVPTQNAGQFRAQFSREAFFVEDHRIGGACLVPGGVLMETLRVAASRVSGRDETPLPQRVSNVRWMAPLAVEESVETSVIVEHRDGSEEAFHVRIESEGEIVAEATVESATVETPPSQDIDALQSQCGTAQPAEVLYEALADRGLEYGSRMRAVESVWMGERESLARLSRPDDANWDTALSPSVFDGALQTVALLMANEAPGQLFVPAELADAMLYRPLPAEVFVHTRRRRQGEEVEGRFRFDLDLMDQTGDVCAALRGVEVAPAELGLPSSADASGSKNGTTNQKGASSTTSDLLFYTEQWREQARRGSSPEGPILVMGHGEDTVQRTAGRLRTKGHSVVEVQFGAERRLSGENDYRIRPERVEDHSALIDTLLSEGPAPSDLVLLWEHSEITPTVSKGEEATGEDVPLRALFGSLTPLLQRGDGDVTVTCIAEGTGRVVSVDALTGFLRSVERETPHLDGSVIHVQALPPDLSGLPAVVQREVGSSEAAVVRYTGEGRFVQAPRRVAPPRPAAQPGDNLFRSRGVYLISGGTGAIGRHVARYLAETVQARLVLLSRSGLPDDRRELVAEVEAAGGEVLSLQADVTDPEQVSEAVSEAQQHYGALHGVIHSAGVVKDGFLTNKSVDDLEQVWRPKVKGALHLDRATAELPLDLFVLFSSTAGTMGNVGQSVYAAANRFLDSFATRRQAWVDDGRRAGTTCSIGWPLWRDGGMTISEDVEDYILRTAGLYPLDTEDGLRGMADALQLNSSHLLVLDGEREDIEERLEEAAGSALSAGGSVESSPSTSEVTGGATAGNGAGNDEAVRRIEQTLMREWSELTKLPVEELDPKENIQAYGVDSVMITKMNSRLDKHYDLDLRPSIFADHPSIRSLAEYLHEEKGVQPAPSSDGSREGTVDQESVGGASLGDEERETSVGTNGSPERMHSNSDGDASSRSLQGAGTRPVGQKEDIAVVGLVSRLPRSPTLEDLWENVKTGRSLVSDVPDGRWRSEITWKEAERAPSVRGAYLENIDQFDADFFDIDPAEARWMDPQQRLVLELTQHLLDRSGYTSDEIQGKRVGTFIGATQSPYVRDRYQGREGNRLAVSTLQNMIAARVADQFDLQGPAQTIDTACSSSVVALHEACQSLKSGDCETALAGGVELLLNPFAHITLAESGALAEDGITRVFDRRADGFGIGEGVGLTLLKRYEEARADGDRILGVIRASAVNNDGETLGPTMPSRSAQVRLLRRAMDRGDVNPNRISYLEAHGSGTMLGDAVEVEAATETFRQFTERRQYCALGSFSSNAGNLLRAGGIAAFAKVIASLQHQELPPTIHCEEVHPKLNLQESPFYLVREPQPWPKIDGTRIAGISSFGFGGTNAHLVVEEFDADEAGYTSSRTPRPRTVFERRRHWVERTHPENTALESGSASTHSSTSRIEERTHSASVTQDGSDSASSTADVSDVLADLVAEVLNVEPQAIDRTDTLIDAGMSSVNFVQLAQRIEDRFDVDFLPSVFFDYDSISALAEYMKEEYPEACTSLEPYDSDSLESDWSPDSSSSTNGEEAGASRPYSPSAMSQGTGSNDGPAPIAVVGMAGRVGRAESLDAFWEGMKNEVDFPESVPPERLARWGKGEEELDHAYGSFLRDVDRFDASFFGISPREAGAMDPQVRLLMETIYTAAEDAACVPQLAGSNTGVYMGATFRDYEHEMIRHGVPIGPHDGTGVAGTMAANRVSYALDLKGPSLTIDTACSSSLVALHQACRALREGECEAAFAGGANLILTPRHFEYLSEMGALSETGRCYTFDERADGYIPAEAVGALMLKRVEDARKDQDSILAVVEGSAVAHNGTTSSLTSPSSEEQARVVKEAWERAGADLATLDYLETHGTGTELGDPVEVDGLKMVLEEAGGRLSSCQLGSAKAHVGHAEAAAGVVGVLKTILSLREQTIPVMPNFETLNPHVDLHGVPLTINQEPVEWTGSEEHVRRAAVSSFGIGGTNSHVVLREPEPEPASSASDHSLAPPFVFPFSAEEADQLHALLRHTREYLAETEVEAARVATTLQCGREDKSERLAFVASTPTQLGKRIEAVLDSRGREIEGVVRSESASAIAPTSNPGRDASFEAAYKQARRWVLGEEVSWESEEVAARPKPARLPTYPFDGDRYWFTDRPGAQEIAGGHEINGTSSQASVSESSSSEARPVESSPGSEQSATSENGDGNPDGVHFFAPTWRSAPIAEAESASPVLVFAPDQQRAAAADAAVPEGSIIATSETLSPRTTLKNEVQVVGTGDVIPLMRELEAAGRLPSAVVVLGPAPEIGAEAARMEGWPDGLEWIVPVTKALVQGDHASECAVVHAHLTRDGQPRPAHDCVAGWFRSTLPERSGLRVRALRVEGRHSELSASYQFLASVACTEAAQALESDAPDMLEVRRTEEGRFSRTMTVLPSSEAHEAPSTDGTVLITGGAGDLGRAVAHSLAESGTPRLLLTGRSPLDEERQALLDALLDRGARDAIYLQADVTDAEDMKACVAFARAHAESLDLVFHAAGTVDENKTRIDALDRETIDGILAAKCQGVAVLDAATRNEPLDAFVVFSSIASCLNTAGQAPYAAANRFMDAFAKLRTEWSEAGDRAGHTLSINWPYWREGGMQMSKEREAIITEATGIRPLETEEGLEALWTSLALARQEGHEQVAVAAGRHDDVADTLAAADGTASQSSSIEDAPPENVGEESHEALVEALLPVLSTQVIETLRLRTERVHPDKELGRLGFESVTIAEFVESVNKQLGTSISPAVFYEIETLRGFARHLVRESTAEIRSFCSDESQEGETSASDPAEEQKMSSPSSVPSPPAAELEKEDGTADESESEIQQETLSPSPPSSSSSPDPTGPAGIAGSHNDDVAIIGMAGRFPKSPDLQTLWANLVEERDLTSPLPTDRFHWEGDSPPVAANRGGFLDDVASFDPLFFGISPGEAKRMDPQQRLLLQSAWHAIEHSGYRPSALAGEETGVFVGVSNVDYRDVLSAAGEVAGAHALAGLSVTAVPNRVSYLLDLHGPSEPVDTGCSSSLVALHRALRSVRSGECSTALAAGVNLLISPAPFVTCTEADMLSPEGRCKTFSKGADGYVRGEGVGGVLLKPLQQAQADGDTVHAVLKGSAVNHGGHVSEGFTVPNPTAQANCLIDAYENADIDPATLSYVETHGTGTELGDPIEITGLKRTFDHYDAADPDRSVDCMLGSVKTNMGHLESAAGIAGVIKTVLALKHETIPGVVHFEELNPYIDTADTPFSIARETTAWPQPETSDGRPVPRRAGVSSFGFGGTNAHVVLEEAPSEKQSPAFGETRSEEDVLIVLSAQSEERLEAYADVLADHLSDVRPALVDLAYTLQVGRDAMEVRLAFPAGSISEVIDTFETDLETLKNASGVVVGSVEDETPADAPIQETSAGRDFIRQLADERNLESLADLWVTAVDLPWEILYDNEPRRLPLPGYPFAQRRCWAHDDPLAFGSSAANTAFEVESASETDNLSPASSSSPSDELSVSPEAPSRDSAPDRSVQSNRSDPDAPSENPAVGGAEWTDAVESWVRSMVAEVVEVDPDLLRDETPLSDYGVDSIVGMELLERLQEYTGSLPRDLLYQHRTLSALGEAVAEQALENGVEQFPPSSVQTVGDAGPMEETPSKQPSESLTESSTERIIANGDTDNHERRRFDTAARDHFEPLVQTCRRQAGNRETFDAEIFHRLDAVARCYLVRWFQEQGWFQSPGATVERTVLKRQLSVAPEKERLFAALIDLLLQSDYLTVEGDRLEATLRVREAQEAEAREESLLEDAPDAEGYLRLLHHCLEQYASVLAGRTEGVEVLFPNGQTDYVDRVYRDNRRADYFNQLVAEGVAGVVEATADPVSIVEVGAGTGGTAASVLPVVAPYAERVRYHYTDISPQFLEVGRRRFGEEHSFVQFQEFDATERPGSQGMEEGRHDVILATNVLHATERIGTTLNRLKRLLRPGGVLLINEVTRSADVVTMTFGLTEQWWAYEDPEQRLPNAPLLSVSQWREALAAAGYHRVEAIGFPEQSAEESGQGLLVAESDGEIEVGKQVRTEEGGQERRSRSSAVSAQEQSASNGASASSEETSSVEEQAFEGDKDGALRSPPASSPSRSRGAGAPSRSASTPIAVVGVSGIFPGARSADALWESVEAGEDMIREIPEDRFDWRSIYGDATREENTMNSKWGGFVEGIDEFDPYFFGIAPREAKVMDPQQRLLLEVVWRTFEDAGHRPSEYAGTDTGVFVGLSATDYLAVLREQELHNGPLGAVGLSRSIHSNRVSHHFDLKGPSETIDTACSSSLVAAHQAVRSIQAGDCSMAVVGGANAILTSDLYVAFSQAGFLSPTGSSRPFDKAADGYVRGEGAGAILMKPLDKARADGDYVYGLIRGTAVNHGGHVSEGITVPNAEAQSAVIRDAIDDAGIDPRTIGYVETHGTGTQVGDPLEIEGLCRGFRKADPELEKVEEPFCGLGALKSNIGHLEGAAGIAGLIKVLYAHRYQTLPPIASFETANPYLDLDGSPFYLVTEEDHPWEAPHLRNGARAPRRAGVSSFGFGGTNAHVIVEEAPDVEMPTTSGASLQQDAGSELIVLSARTSSALDRMVARLANDLQDRSPSHRPRLQDIAFTLQVGREDFSERLAFVVDTFDDLLRRLNRLATSTSEMSEAVFGEEALTAAARGRVSEDAETEVAPIPEHPDHDDLLALGRAWVEGQKVHWSRLHEGRSSRRTPLPTYPFERERFWPDEADASEDAREDEASAQAEADAVRSEELEDGTSSSGEMSSEEDWEQMLTELQDGTRSLEEVEDAIDLE